MLSNDERFQSCPELPQYGNQVASCVANLPRVTNFWAKAGITLALFVGTYVVVVVLAAIGVRSLFPDEATALMAANGIALVAAVVACIAVQYDKPSTKAEAIFVFEGGIHLNENVLYTVPGGSHRLSVCSGMRQVSLPWRVLKDFQIKKTQHNGKPHVEASFRMPDGRTMEVVSYSGGDAALAIQKIHQRLGNQPKA